MNARYQRVGAPSRRSAASHKSDSPFHHHLADFNRDRLTPSTSGPDEQLLREECEVRILEMRFVETERDEVAELTATAPSSADEFAIWFEKLLWMGPGQGHQLFPWLAFHASREDMRWFLQQELAHEAGLEDRIALTQIQLPAPSQLEMARGYWDEMGRGHECATRREMLGRLAREFELDLDATEVVWESVALDNLMVALATQRHYAYESVGALAAVQLTAFRRAEQVNAGLARLGVPGHARQYYALRAQLGVERFLSWSDQVIRPLVSADPSVAERIAAGALMRLRAGERCFERYAETLWGGEEPQSGWIRVR